ncbi:MAG: hypothetical protein J0J01_19820 [Reyranella sp.]|uniref:hypothetical protein n=1 Tax=Reyranella sp. TaxID=1929291 RepID=UPI001AC30931|nr:hypothetical protein [Reyranella sp.]MBN9089160.1 hypothetical protein [Reyranella sp.]
MSAITTATVLAGVSLAATAAGTAMSAMAASRQAQAQSDAANYQAQVARNNQKIADWKAADDLARGRVAEDQRRMKTALQIATQRAAMAGNGSDVNSGSAIDIVGDTAAAGEFDALTIRNNAERAAYGDKVQAGNFGADATLKQQQVAYADGMAGLGVGANLLAGASTVADKWAAYKDKIMK